MTLEKIKKAAIYAVVGICTCGGFFCGGYLVRQYTTSPVIVVGDGKIVERTNYVFKTINTNDYTLFDCVNRYNSLASEFQLFLRATPKVLEVTDAEIRFALYTQKYSLPYKQGETTKRWSITPCLSARVDFKSGIYYGGGCAVDYDGIGGGIIIDNAGTIQALAYYRIRL